MLSRHFKRIKNSKICRSSENSLQIYEKVIVFHSQMKNILYLSGVL